MCTVTVRGPCAKDLYGYSVKSKSRYSALMTCLHLVFEHKIGKPIDAFVSCGLQGTDWIFYETAEIYAKEHLGVRNYLYEPFAGVQSRWKDFGMFQKGEYERLREAAKARGTLVVCGSQPSSAKDFGKAVGAAYAKALQDSDVVICLAPWRYAEDGAYVLSQEGRRIVQNAKWLRKDVVLIDPDTLYIFEAERVVV